ncbi:MAG: leucine-rich repeat protein, partial [Clostridia bacterium]|nr:leucine-rich repeat protein [Clostridia bacterium]
MKSYVKAVGLFLSLAIILPTFSTTVSALAASDFSTDNKLSVLSEDAIDSGNCGEALLWSLDSDGTLVIEGKGPMADYRSGNQPWSANMNSIKTLVIEEGVTSIGNYAFYNCSSISGDLVIPDSVTSIGNYAFYRCTG